MARRTTCPLIISNVLRCEAPEAQIASIPIAHRHLTCRLGADRALVRGVTLPGRYQRPVAVRLATIVLE